MRNFAYMRRVRLKATSSLHVLGIPMDSSPLEVQTSAAYDVAEPCTHCVPCILSAIQKAWVPARESAATRACCVPD
jgi:hypothetical protein